MSQCPVVPLQMKPALHLPRHIAAKILETPGLMDTPCWVWIGAKDQRGYGNVRVGRRVRKAHLVAYECLRGPLPPGTEGDHLCRNRGCINPYHLEPITHRENAQRGDGSWMPGERNRAKTSCPHGHPYSLENTYVQPSTGGRCCRACDREKKRRRPLVTPARG